MANDYDEYDDEYEDEDVYEDAYEDEDVLERPPVRQPMARPRAQVVPAERETQMTRQALDWGISGSIIAILVLTALYAFSPIDFVPDVIPVAGQADDIAAILAGGGSVLFLTALRFLLRTRVGRLGCVIGIILAAVGAFTVFWLLMDFFDSIL